MSYYCDLLEVTFLTTWLTFQTFPDNFVFDLSQVPKRRCGELKEIQEP